MTSLTSVSDSLLIESYLSGNQKAFAQLVRRYQSRIFTTANLVVRDRYVAEDILQDTFCKFVLVLKNGGYTHSDKLSGYLVRIAHNLAIDHVRKMKVAPQIVSHDGEDIFRFLNISDNSSLITEEKEMMLADLKWAITQLPDQQREIVILRCFSNLTFKDISEITGLNVNTALGRMRYAVQSLKKILATKKEKYDPNLYPQ
ncbi:MAG TPA: sigma-70 family RNA polymerase sigma factor [Catalimonadaceae bacterium]|jgi:RNA polymerase sigma factor (sigma-70 family)|nr:sigma-70 family RNA polymerase sigma factor [Catalimonadaceae bacterium]